MSSVPLFSTVMISWNFVGKPGCVAVPTWIRSVGVDMSLPVVGSVKDPFMVFIMRTHACLCGAMVMVPCILTVSFQWE